jgi:hypothetical protein
MSLALNAAVMMDDMPAFGGCDYTSANRVKAFSSWGLLGFAPPIIPTGKVPSFMWAVARGIC